MKYSQLKNLTIEKCKKSDIYSHLESVIDRLESVDSTIYDVDKYVDNMLTSIDDELAFKCMLNDNCVGFCYLVTYRNGWLQAVSMNAEDAMVAYKLMDYMHKYVSTTYTGSDKIEKIKIIPHENNVKLLLSLAEPDSVRLFNTGLQLHISINMDSLKVKLCKISKMIGK